MYHEHILNCINRRPYLWATHVWNMFDFAADTLGELRSNPGTAPIVNAMMAKASASRGDVASSTAGNANLQRMLGAMTLQSLLKQAGEAVKPEQVKALNDALQRIKKADV